MFVDDSVTKLTKCGIFKASIGKEPSEKNLSFGLHEQDQRAVVVHVCKI